MTSVEKLLAVASAEIGTTEEPIGSKRQKYGEAYGWNGVDWCMQFVWYCFYAAGLSKLFYGGKKTASCTALMNWAKANGQFVTENYQPGDVLLYQFDTDAFADHTGIYTGTKDGRGRLLAIEGNYNHRVQTVAQAEKNLWGAFRPKWPEETAVVPPVPQAPAIETPASSVTICKLEISQVKSGDKNSTVKAMQILLIGYGYSCGIDGADGDFGTNTKNALLRYQRAAGLTADGICGKDTWLKLLKG